LDIPEKTYDEDDETMMIVRGYGSLDDTKIADETIPEETFTLCDYYQIQGNEHIREAAATAAAGALNVG